MKRILLSALLGTGMVAAIFQILPGSRAERTPDLLVRRGGTFNNNSPAPTPPDSYPLVCRGGGRLVFVGEGSLVIGAPTRDRNIGFVFTRGQKPAGTRPSPSDALAPGECSWVDRGMRADEPDSVTQHIEEGSESLKAGGKLAPEHRWFEELHSKDSYWTFMVFNNGRRHAQLFVTSARPNANVVTEVLPTARVPSDLAVIERPKSYPLLCRGSESLVTAFTPGIRAIGFTFTRGSKPAGEGLDPGECSWVDRGMHADEPNTLSQDVEEGWEGLKGGRSLPREDRWFEDLRSSRKSWRFMVYNHRGVLHVTSARDQ